MGNNLIMSRTDLEKMDGEKNEEKWKKYEL